MEGEYGLKVFMEKATHLASLSRSSIKDKQRTISNVSERYMEINVSAIIW